MKRLTFLFIIILSLVTGKVTAQCADAGVAVAAICQGGTSAALGGSFNSPATSAVWSDGGAGGTFSNNGGSTPGTATYTASSSASGSITLTLTAHGGACEGFTATKSITVNANPAVDVGSALSAICQGGTTTALGGSFGGGATSAIWDDGGAGGSFTNNTGATPGTVTYTASASSPATVTLTLTTSGGSCGTTSANKTLTVNPNPTASAGAALADICQDGTSAALGGSVGGGATGGTWSTTSGGTFSPSATNLNATWKPDAGWSGTATLVLTTSGGSCGTATDSKTIKVLNHSTVDAGGAMSAICQGGTSAALGGSVGGGATTGIWDDGGAGGSFTNNAGANPDLATYTAASNSTSPVTLTLTASGGSCGTATASKQIVVNQSPTVTVGSALTPVCQGQTTVALGGSFGGSATSAIWSDGGAGGIFSNNSGSTPGAATYTALTSTSPVTLTLTTGGGSCGTATANKQLTVNAAPVANNQTPAVCEDSYGSGSATGVNLTLLESSITGGAANRTVAWYSDAGHLTSVPTPSNVTVTNGKTYYPLVTNTVSSCTSGATVTYTVNSKPVATSVQITGAPAQGSTLTGNYTYTTGACNPEVVSKTEISWYVADDNIGTNSTWVATKSGIDKTYLLTAADAGKYIQVCVRVSDGSIPLAPSQCSSGWTGPVALNTKPVATGVSISGTTKVKRVLTGIYTYNDAEGDLEGLSVFQWYTADDATGLNEQIISGAASVTYQLTNSEIGKYIGFKVKPVALTGTLVGNTVSAATWVGPVTNDPPTATGINITGSPLKVSTILSGHYTYSDFEGDLEGASVYQWYTATDAAGTGSTPIAGATSMFYQLTANEFGKYAGFSVTPVAQTGTASGTLVKSAVYVGPITDPPPVATSVSIAGTKNVNAVITGQYTYTDAEGDAENGSVYKWFLSATLGGTYNVIAGETAQTHLIASAEQGMYFKFSVIPKTLTGSTTGTEVTSAAFGPVNTKPSASGVSISGSPLQVGTTLTGSYSYSDPDGDLEGTSTYRWFRDGAVITGATSVSYLLTSSDAGALMGFEVTPVSSTGFPNTGNAVSYTLSSTVSDPSGTKPVASNVCIDGKRTEGYVLTGKYTYTYAWKSEGTSTYKWYRGGVAIPGETSINYTLTSADMDQDIVFEVTPKSSNSTPKVGDPVQSKSLARITMTKVNFISSDKDTILTAEPTGGYFWGTGVLNGKFSPRSVDYTKGADTVTYHLNDYNCGQDAVSIITVSGVTAYFTGFNTFYCQNGTWDTIMVRNIPADLIYRGFWMDDYSGWVDQLNDTTIIIDPSRMAAGSGQNYLYFYAIDYWYSTWLEIYQPFDIEAIQPVTINLADNSVFCNNDPKIELFVNQTGGVYSGPVSGGYFDPSLAIGNTTVGYTYTSKKGCVSSISVPVTINPAPIVSFAAADSCISNNKDVTQFINYTTSADPISKWWWEFSDAGVNHPDSVMSPGYLYVTGGFHKITLTATTINGCSNTDIETIEMANRPHTDFYWKNECMHASDSIMLFDSTTSSTKITSRSWNFFDGDSLHTVLNPHYPQKSVGYLNVEYIVRTNYNGCFDTMRKSIYIRPTISLAKDDYFENFENGNGSWVKNYDTLNTWSFGTPSRSVIKTAASGSNAWFTNYSLTNEKKESSSIISPCFNFDSIQRPMISMKLWSKFDKNRDGAALQYKIKDGDTWNYVGSFEDGINWYNSTLIQGRPGGDQIGWTSGTDLDKGWGEAKHKLDDLVGKKDVKFRVVYGSNGTAQDNDGIAFDDIWIGRRTRGVLLEHFTNNTSSEASSATAMVSDLSNRWPDDIINIQYHTNFPGVDPYYDANPGDASARLLFYGLSRAPYTFIDGGGDTKNYATLFDYIVAALDSNDVNRRSLINPYFQITLNSNISSGVVSVTGQIKAFQDVNVSNVTLFLVVTQKKSTGPAGALGETDYYNVFRKFIPDAGGITLNNAWAKNDTYTLAEKSWVISNIPNGADIEVIAFIQNNITKEVYQAESVLKPNITVGIDDLFTGNGKEFALYPNPASSKLTIAFEKPITSATDIKIYDYSGTLLKAYKTGTGGSEYVIEDLGLKNGIYLIRISSDGIDLGFKKLIVSDR